MEHTITEFKEWPKGLEVSYHDWVVKASKNEITEKLGFGPTKIYEDEDWTYQWNCLLDGGKYYFTIYDMSYGETPTDDEVIEWHIGFKDKYDDIHHFFPDSIEGIDMIESLGERGFDVDHSETWKDFHNDGILDQIEGYIKQQMIIR